MGGSVPKRPIERAVWHPWLDRLTCTGRGLRARARYEPVKHRHFRLLVLAQLREGHLLAEVAETAGVWPRAIYRLRIAALRGLDTLLQRSTEHLRLTRTQAAEIVQWLDSLPEPATPGFRLIQAREVVTEVGARFGSRSRSTSAGRSSALTVSGRPIATGNARFVPSVHELGTQFMVKAPTSRNSGQRARVVARYHFAFVL